MSRSSSSKLKIREEEDSDVIDAERRVHNAVIRRELKRYPNISNETNKPDKQDNTLLHKLVIEEEPDLEEVKRLINTGALTLLKNKKRQTVFDAINIKAKGKLIPVKIPELENPINLTLQQYIGLCMIAESIVLVDDPDFLKKLLAENIIFQTYDWTNIPAPNSLFWAKLEAKEMEYVKKLDF